jgi:hypothetical protein
MELQGDVCQVETHVVLFGDSVNIGACFCAECTIGMEIFLAHPMALLCDVGQVEARFGLFGDSINLDAR